MSSRINNVQYLLAAQQFTMAVGMARRLLAAYNRRSPEVESMKLTVESPISSRQNKYSGSRP